MAKLQFIFEVPDYITENKDWFEYLAKIFRDMAEEYQLAADNSPDGLLETHPFYASMLPNPIPHPE